MESGSRKQKSGKVKAGDISQKFMQEVTAIYVFLIMVVYPFYYQNKYYNMGYAKWKFFLVVTLGAGTVLAAAFIFSLGAGYYRQGRKLREMLCSEKPSVTDWFMSAYVIAVLISTALSPYRDQVIWGYRGWYMGLIAQVSFVLIYYFVSRYWRWDGFAIGCYLAAAFLVFLLAVAMRFGIDPLGLYENLEERYVINFLTTIGQVTWYSSYAALLLPLGVFAFWHYDNIRVRILGGIFATAGFMTVVTQNSDSIFIALGILFLVLFWVSLESNKRLGRFLEVLIMCIASFKFIGVCQGIFTERAVLPDGISLFLSESRLTWLVLAFAILCYFWVKKTEKSGEIDICKVKVIRVILFGIILVGVFIAVLYIYLNTEGGLPEQLRSENHYLLFDEYWGNNRGFTWVIAVKSYLKGNAVCKLWGCGPDGFSLYVQNFFREELAKKWGESGMLACAHNEWLNVLVNLGLLGFIAYTGIFVSTICCFFRKSGEHPELMAIAISIVCYMGHNFFCYQQIVAAPVVFILMGVGEAIIRHGKNDIATYNLYSNC